MEEYSRINDKTDVVKRLNYYPLLRTLIFLALINIINTNLLIDEDINTIP